MPTLPGHGERINAGNVAGLEPAWSWEIPKTGARIEATPLIADGVLYATGRHGGTLSTAGGLVFWGTGSRLVALDAQTGRELWEAELDGSPGSPVTYYAGGRQYVAIGSGQASGRSLPRMWAFALPEGAR